jgi:hypothetical protein
MSINIGPSDPIKFHEGLSWYNGTCLTRTLCNSNTCPCRTTFCASYELIDAGFDLYRSNTCLPRTIFPAPRVFDLDRFHCTQYEDCTLPKLPCKYDLLQALASCCLFKTDFCLLYFFTVSNCGLLVWYYVTKLLQERVAFFLRSCLVFT